VYLKRPGGQSQFSELLQAQAEAVAVFDELNVWSVGHLDRTDLSVELLADRVHMSPRNFARVYKQKTGCTSAKAVQVYRLEAARRLCSKTQRTMSIRLRCSAASVTRSACGSRSSAIWAWRRATTASGSRVAHFTRQLRRHRCRESAVHACP